jgi:hypothetical protein
MKRYAIGLAALLLAGTAGGASAQTLSYAQAGALIAKSCGPSIERFCSKENLGSGQIQQCLSQHQDQVPAQCFTDYGNVVASITKRVAAQEGAFKVCENNVRQFCSGVQPGDANILNCLLESSKVVSGSCKQVLLDAGWQ